MKLCLNCGTHYGSSELSCTKCGYHPDCVDGFESYAPDLAHGGGGFKASYFSNLASLEESNFWFRARNQQIIWALNKYASGFESFLEIGCGTGYVLSEVAGRFSDAALNGSEIFTKGLDFAAKRLPDVNFMQMDARNIPFYVEFDVIGAFDVLEHIKEDECVLGQVWNALKPQGMLFLTVPQHEWLWSPVDEYACHERRYIADDLHKKVKSAGFRVIRSTSFVTALLPAMFISRFFQKQVPDEEFDATSELKISPLLNSIFYKLLTFELALIKRGVNFPIGGSRLVVAQKV